MEIIEFTESNIEQHLEQCVAIQKHLIKPGEPVNKTQFIETAKDSNTYFMAVANDGVILGLGVLGKIVHPVQTNAYINNIVVHPDARGQGLFSVIMDNLETKAKDWGCTRVDLTCSRPKVQGMYEKRGYIEKDTKFYILKLE